MEGHRDGHVEGHRDGWMDIRMDIWMDTGIITGTSSHMWTNAGTHGRVEAHPEARTNGHGDGEIDEKRRKKEAEIRAGAAETRPCPRAPRRRRSRRRMRKVEEGEDQPLPGILRLRSQVLPMVAMEGAWRRRVMLSFIRPSPVTFTVKGLPACDSHLKDLVIRRGPQCHPVCVPTQYHPHLGRVCQQT